MPGNCDPCPGKTYAFFIVVCFSAPTKLKKIVYICPLFRPYSLMDRMEDSGSFGRSSILRGATKSGLYSWAALAPEKGGDPQSGEDRQAIEP